MLTRMLVVFALALFAASAQNASVNLEGWKVKPGDNPAWAAPDFDDRDWQSSPAPQLYTVTRADSAGRSVRWYRTQVRVPAGWATQQLAMAVPPLDEAYEIYVEGVRIGGRGTFGPSPIGRFERHASYRLLPLSSGQESIHIAIRRWAAPSNASLVMLTAAGQIGGERHPPRLGPAVLLDTQEELHRLAGERAATPRRAASWILLLLGLVAILLYREQPTRHEYLWLGVTMGSFGLFPLLGTLAVGLDLPNRSLFSTFIVFFYVMAAAWSSLLLRSLAPRVGWLMLGAAGISLINGVWFPISFYFGLPRNAEVSSWEPLIVMCAQASVALWLLFVEKRLREFILALCWTLFELSRNSNLLGINSFLNWNGYTFDRRDTALVLIALCSLFVLYLRFRDEQKEQRRRAQELAAGQRVQEFLLASESTGNALFATEKAYLPALEVGGDFYQFVSRPDGSLMVVVGDVSGKGLEAAMMGARILGALETLTDLTPGQVLSRLNQTLHRRSKGGFVTCCCALFAPDDSVTLANAGHPSPYADGREIEVEPGLPLGVLDLATYDESVVTGQSFTFVSDGVVEAENAQRELFGFDRTRNVSTQSAKHIAEAAKAWGQNDDITVVTVRRTP